MISSSQQSNSCALCGQETRPGNNLCDKCMGIGMPFVPPGMPPIIGVTPPAELKRLIGKKLRPAHNRNPREKVKCACGKIFERPVTGLAGLQRGRHLPEGERQ